MTDKLLRHIPTGVIWVSQPAWETRSDFEPYEPEVVPEETPAAPTPRKPRAAKVVEPVIVPDEPVVPDEALSQEASRGL